MSSMIGEHKTGNTNNEYKTYGKTKMNWVQKQTIRINHTAILLQVEWSAPKKTYKLSIVGYWLDRRIIDSHGIPLDYMYLSLRFIPLG